ncbi:MAG: haloalkane dehalogenase [Actinomycetota bacterium]|nr:haloalkane dehalogenase [Actinomycetota bacterium]
MSPTMTSPTGLEFLRTPDERFESLLEWPFEPHYVTLNEGLRVHYVDEGTGPTVLLLHGEPTWGYLYRKMIPGLVHSGCRVIVPDLVGFGRSDKPSLRDDYTYGRHLRWLTETIQAIEGAAPLGTITMFCQDWGGLIGLSHMARHPATYRGVVVSNTGVPLGRDIRMNDDDGFSMWRRFSQDVTPFLASVCVGGSSSPLNAKGFELSQEEQRAYDAPFPDEDYVAGARQFPLLVPTSSTHPSAPICWETWSLLATCEVPLTTAFASDDEVTGPLQGLMSASVPGAANQPHVIIENAGHFIQEHQPDQCVDAILGLLKRTE